MIPRTDPAIVILAHRTVDDPNNPLPLLDEQSHRVVRGAARTAGLRSSITSVVQLRADGRTVILIEQIPVSTDAGNPETCLSKARNLGQCRFVSHVTPGLIEVCTRAAQRAWRTCW